MNDGAILYLIDTESIMLLHFVICAWYSSILTALLSFSKTVLLLRTISLTLFRIFVENFREPDLHIGYIYNVVTMGMILSFPFMIAGMCLMFYAIKINGKN